VPQGLPSASLLFNLYINATLQEFNSRSNGFYPYADDNTLRYHARHKESKLEFVFRMRRVLVSVEKGYQKIKGVLSKDKSPLPLPGQGSRNITSFIEWRTKRRG
jgi:hypothetical protein